ncbi:MAG: metallophosphoesterase [Gaiellales bacterium]|nr:MAG: metallophosphoesterase [Gaiellales bacterium]
MKVLVLSDIHGNIDALEAIDEPCDRILFLGDVVDYGPEPAACIEYLAENNALRVRGNHDNAVAFRVDCACGEAFKHLSVITREFMWQVLGPAQLEWVGRPATSLELLQGGKSIYATHAAPTDNLFKYLTPDTPDDELAREAEATSADIILTGHTHKPFAREVSGRLVVNVGSVGQPRDGIPRASYAVIEDGQVELRRIDYDVERAVSRVLGMPIDQEAARQLAFILEHAQAPPL